VWAMTGAGFVPRRDGLADQVGAGCRMAASRSLLKTTNAAAAALMRLAMTAADRWSSLPRNSNNEARKRWTSTARSP
jgi:hypothetical protein